MFGISKEELADLRSKYKVGARVKLLRMDDPYQRALKPGALGTVRCVDDAGTIHVSWDTGSRLGVAYGEDECCVVDSEAEEDDVID